MLRARIDAKPAVRRLRNIALRLPAELRQYADKLQEIAKRNAVEVIGGKTGRKVGDSVRITPAGISTSDPIAIHKQKGGVIRARGKLLRIPLPGKDQTQKAFVVRSKLGNLVVLAKSGPIAVLKTEVRQRAFPWWPDRPQAIAELRRHMERLAKQK